MPIRRAPPICLLCLWLLLLCGPAAAFEFTDVTGKPARLADHKGKWVLVTFWSTWCPICIAEIPFLTELSKRRDFVVIGVGMDYGPDARVVEETAKHRGMGYTVVAGGSRRDANAAYQQIGPVDFFPTAYLFNPEGKSVAFLPGTLNHTRLTNTLKKLASK